MHSSHVQKWEVLKAQKESCIPEHVTFCDAEDDYYPVGQDVRCSYKILASLEPNSYDWVGLFKAGSSLPSEYVYYEWSPLPKDYVKGTDVMNAVVFPGNRMPTEDGKLYQFCYVSADGKMSGTSKRFRFRLPKSVEILDDAEEQEGELVILRTKTSTLEAKIRETMEENVILKEKLDHMDDASLCLLDTHNQFEQELSRTMEELSRTKEELSRTKQLKSRLQMKIDVADSIREFQKQTLKWHAARVEEKVSLINENNARLLQNNARLLDKVTANGQIDIPVIMDLVQEVRQAVMDCGPNYFDIREETDDVQTKLLQAISQHLL